MFGKYRDIDAWSDDCKDVYIQPGRKVEQLRGGGGSCLKSRLPAWNSSGRTAAPGPSSEGYADTEKQAAGEGRPSPCTGGRGKGTQAGQSRRPEMSPTPSSQHQPETWNCHPQECTLFFLLSAERGGPEGHDQAVAEKAAGEALTIAAGHTTRPSGRHGQQTPSSVGIQLLGSRSRHPRLLHQRTQDSVAFTWSTPANLEQGPSGLFGKLHSFVFRRISFLGKSK